MMALIKETDNFYLFDSHARDSSGIPDPSGTAVVMTFTNIIELEQYLYCLSMELHTNSFEIVPVQLNICKTFDRKIKCFKDQEYQRVRRSEEKESDKQVDLTKLMSIIKESDQRKLIARNKLGFKTIESLKKESSQRKLITINKLDFKMIESNKR